jgi:hypothetical protein
VGEEITNHISPFIYAMVAFNLAKIKGHLRSNRD